MQPCNRSPEMTHEKTDLMRIRSTTIQGAAVTVLSVRHNMVYCYSGPFARQWPVFNLLLNSPGGVEILRFAGKGDPMRSRHHAQSLKDLRNG